MQLKALLLCCDPVQLKALDKRRRALQAFQTKKIAAFDGPPAIQAYIAALEQEITKFQRGEVTLPARTLQAMIGIMLEEKATLTTYLVQNT